MVAGKAHTTRRKPWTYRPISYVSSEGIQALTPFTKLSIGRVSTPLLGAYKRQRSPRPARGAWRPCSACSRRARSFTKKPLLCRCRGPTSRLASAALTGQGQRRINAAATSKGAVDRPRRSQAHRREKAAFSSKSGEYCTTDVTIEDPKQASGLI